MSKNHLLTLAKLLFHQRLNREQIEIAWVQYHYYHVIICLNVLILFLMIDWFLLFYPSYAIRKSNQKKNETTKNNKNNIRSAHVCVCSKVRNNFEAIVPTKNRGIHQTHVFLLGCTFSIVPDTINLMIARRGCPTSCRMLKRKTWMIITTIIIIIIREMSIFLNIHLLYVFSCSLLCAAVFGFDVVMINMVEKRSDEEEWRRHR